MNYQKEKKSPKQLEGGIITYKKTKMTANFPSEIRELPLISSFKGTEFYIFHYVTLRNYGGTRTQYNNIFQMLKEKNYLPEILYLIKTPMRNKDKIETFPGKGKLGECVTGKYPYK